MPGLVRSAPSPSEGQGLGEEKRRCELHLGLDPVLEEKIPETPLFVGDGKRRLRPARRVEILFRDREISECHRISPRRRIAHPERLEHGDPVASFVNFGRRRDEEGVVREEDLVPVAADRDVAAVLELAE